VFKHLRIAFLLYLLLFVAVTDYLGNRRLSAWDSTVWVDVYPVNGDGTERTAAYLEQHASMDLARLSDFARREAAAYAVHVDPPLRFELARQLHTTLPPAPSSALGALWWSLRMRWFATRLHWQSDRPTPDITLFAVYYDGGEEPTLDRSLGLKKGRLAVANLFADDEMSGSNEVIIMHELLHTLGASDKYDPESNLPRFPDGYAEPDARPLYPQRYAEIMGGRRPLTPTSASIPLGLGETVIGPVTALEIGWTESLEAGARSRAGLSFRSREPWGFDGQPTHKDLYAHGR